MGKRGLIGVSLAEPRKPLGPSGRGATTWAPGGPLPRRGEPRRGPGAHALRGSLPSPRRHCCRPRRPPSAQARGRGRQGTGPRARLAAPSRGRVPGAAARGRSEPGLEPGRRERPGPAAGRRPCPALAAPPRPAPPGSPPSGSAGEPGPRPRAPRVQDAHAPGRARAPRTGSGALLGRRAPPGARCPPLQPARVGPERGAQRPRVDTSRLRMPRGSAARAAASRRPASANRALTPGIQQWPGSQSTGPLAFEGTWA